MIQEIKKGDSVRFSEHPFNLEIKGVSEKAFLVVITNNSWLHESAKSVWVPKSLCTVYEVKAAGTGFTQFGSLFMVKDLPTWFAKKTF
jgi:hypothetical protein